MSPLAVLRIAVRALARNKLRSFLTALGIIIGVAAVIAMVSIGEGAKARVAQTIESMGSNLLVVRGGSSSGGGVRGGFDSQPTLTWDDLDAIRDELPSVRFAAPLLGTGAEVIADGANWTTQVQGTTPAYFAIRNWDVALGTLFTESDVASAAKVVLLGRTVADELYGAGSDPLGQTVRVRNAPFTVVGVLQSKGQSGWGRDNDDAVFVPVSTYQSRIEGGLSKFIAGQLMIGAYSTEGTQAAETQIRALLRERHRLAPNAEDDFSIRNLAEMASAAAESTQTMTALLAGIAFVSLVVGGIGIMNIMLVSVTERTREIGVRMAVGARPGDILAQFLVESLVLSVVGGIVGVALGIGTAQQLAERFGWSLLVRADIVVLAVGISGLVGVVFGLYPARRASRLDPIEALRFE
ncbi:MAG: ABC transporter permease [Sinimarinibacterium flocculans]|uniref:ABC transporter permease n=1 Tax=Sinimarinibacterium flocculans TaxID=985250 RepID=UPI003C5B20AF